MRPGEGGAGGGGGGGSHLGVLLMRRGAFGRVLNPSSAASAEVHAVTPHPFLSSTQIIAIYGKLKDDGRAKWII